jgi:hypothetical protein
MTTWDPAHTDAGWTLSNGDLTATATTSSSIYTVSTTRKTVASGGKYYAEFTLTGIGGGAMALALADDTYSVPGPINTTQSFVVVSNGFMSCWSNNFVGTDWSSGSHTVDIAVDLDASPHRYFTRIDGGAWENSGDPPAATGGLTPGSAESTDLRLAMSAANTGTVCTMNAGATTFARTPPSGFTGWDAPSGSTGTLAVTEAQDTASMTGTQTIGGTLAVTEAQDTMTSTSPDVTGTLAATETQDTFNGTGTPIIIGTLAATEAQDIFAAAGYPLLNGTLNATEAQDVFTAAGTGPVQGTLAATEAQDMALISGIVTTGATSRRRPLIIS